MNHNASMLHNGSAAIQCVWYWLFELSYRSWNANIVSQQVQRGYEVAPLDKLTQWTPAEGIFSYFKARLLSQQTQVYQDLMERKVTEVTEVTEGCVEGTDVAVYSIVQILKDYSVN